VALTKFLNFKGLNVPGAYHRITYVGQSVLNSTVAVEMEVYSSKTNRESGTTPLESKTLVLKNEPAKTHTDVDGKVVVDSIEVLNYDAFVAAPGNPIARSYTVLKTTPEFTEATDT